MAAPGMRLKMNTISFIAQLGRKGNLLQIAAADSINEAAGELGENYQKRLSDKQRIRTKFTLNSIKTFKATPIRRSGEPRKLSKINAITGVRKMKGGKDHYLAKLEEGRTQKGNPKTKNRVPVPLDTARTGRNINRPIAGQNRLMKGETQTLQISGRVIGPPNDGYTPSQRFGILNSTRSRGTSRLRGDLRKPFYFTGKDGDLGIYKLIGSQFRKIRNLDKQAVRTKGRPHFKRSVEAMRPGRIQEIFVRHARRRLGK